MNTTRFVFKIGPIPGPEGETSAFFAMRAGEDSMAYLSGSNRSGLAQILRDYAAATLECEPGLAAAAAEFGIHVGEVTPQRAQWIGGIGLEMALGDHYRGINRESAFYGFAIACAAFWHAAPWRHESLRRPVEIALRGTLNDTLAGIVLSGSDQCGLSIYQGQETVRTLIALARAGHLEVAARTNSLIVTFADQPAFAADAVRRAYGFPRIPLAIKMHEGHAAQLEDLDLLALGAATKAVSMLTDQTLASTAKIVADDVEVEAIAHVTGTWQSVPSA